MRAALIVRYFGSLACTLTTLFCSQSAHADDAATLFRRGRTLAIAGDAAGAYAAFTQSHALRPNYDAAGNASQQAAKLEKWPETCNLASYSLTHLPVSMPSEKRTAVTAILNDLLQQSAPQVGKVRIETTDGAELFADGALLGRTPLDPPAHCLATGAHQLRASLPGFETSTTTVEVRPGETTVVQLPLTTAQPLSTANPSDAGDGSAGPEVAIIVPIAVLAAAGVGTGIGLLVAASATRTDGDDRLSALPQSNPCIGGGVNEVECSTVDQLYGNAGTLEVGGGVAIALGGVAAVGVITYALWPREDADDLGLRVVPMAGPGVGGLAVGGRF